MGVERLGSRRSPEHAGRVVGRSSEHPRQRLLYGWGYEDPGIELSLIPPNSRVLATAGSGEVVASLAAAGHTVDAVDRNRVQLDYAMARMQGGRFEAGSAERFLDLGRALIRAASPAWQRKRVRAFLLERHPATAAKLWRERLDNRTFRGILRATLGPAGSLSAAVQRDFAKPIPPHFDETIRHRLTAAFGRHPLHDDRFAWRLLLGEELPGWKMPKVPEGSVRPIESDLLGHMERAARGSYDAIVLSNVLDGAPPSYVTAVREAARRALVPHGICIARSFHSSIDGEAEALAAADASLVWGAVHIVRG